MSKTRFWCDFGIEEKPRLFVGPLNCIWRRVARTQPGGSVLRHAGSSGHSLFLCSLQRIWPPTCVFHVLMSVPTVACQDPPGFAHSPYTQPQGRRVMTRCSLPLVVGMELCFCHVSNAWAVLPRQESLSRARTAAGSGSYCPVKLSLEGCLASRLLRTNVSQAHPNVDFGRTSTVHEA